MKNFNFRISAVIAAFVILAISPTIANILKPTETSTVPVQEATTVTKNVVVDSVIAKNDDRAKILARYFATKNSPFVKVATNFVNVADKYDIDWTLLPAITGVESSFGLRLPSFSYNPYGWNSGAYNFGSWTNANETVAAALRTRYVPVGTVTAWNVGPTYAADPNWANKVTRYQLEITAFAK